MPPNPPSNSRLPRLVVWSGYGTEEHRGRPATVGSQESLQIEKLSRSTWYGVGVVCGLRKEYTTFGKCRVKGMSSFNFDLIFGSNLQLYRNRPRDLHRFGTLEIFLVSLLYDRICLRTDFFKINYCLNILFIIQLLCVFYSITFVLRNTDPMQRE